MRHYYFHLSECGVVLEDDEGLHLSSLDDARRVGREAACSVMSADVGDGELCLDAYILIEENGAEVARVHFKDALRIIGL